MVLLMTLQEIKIEYIKHKRAYEKADTPSKKRHHKEQMDFYKQMYKDFKFFEKLA